MPTIVDATAIAIALLGQLFMVTLPRRVVNAYDPAGRLRTVERYHPTNVRALNE
jgi:hypothetical protein